MISILRSRTQGLTNITSSTRRLPLAHSLRDKIPTTMAASTTKKKTATKRKTEDQPDDPSSSKPVPTKKAKGPTVPLHAHLPNNRTFPSKLEFPDKKEDVLRISAWNVCGINACEKKGLKTYLMAEDPDIMILSETKMQAEPDILHIKHQFKYRYWGGDNTKGYAGVAILSKHKPLEVVYGLPTADDQSSTKGRIITLEFSTFFLIGTYTPNAGDNLKFMDRKKEWNEAFEKYLRELDANKPVVWGGDINCAPSEKDIRNAESNWNKTAGYTQAECDGLNSQLSPPEESEHEKLVDVWRELNPDLEGHYTYFSYRFKCREKGIGWRIDSFIVSKRVFENVKACEIRQECYGASDHVPVVIEIGLSP
ncbi:exodeoxyribonuclease III [Puccinia triticina 1-1 BBBD Race 1]|uniref:DNA-(apurinic or apyrimidinic site) endonuclease n=1 Tax=Puccinia triticina (isolate 1-1 / race 1 (BBBD)) TaxID=630390 RepID=A0A180G2X6_PUCT1|nr:exodeoxyribonuclease III [Puccinia triticina 1-1 BBBD Race 1]